MKKKAKMGRPPAPWVKKLAESSMAGETYLSAYDLSTELGVQSKTLISFLHKVEAPRKYEIISGNAIAMYQIKDLKDIAKRYLEPWL